MSLIGLLVVGTLGFLFFLSKKKTDHSGSVSNTVKKTSNNSGNNSGSNNSGSNNSGNNNSDSSKSPAVDKRAQPRQSATMFPPPSASPAAPARPSFADQAATQIAENNAALLQQHAPQRTAEPAPAALLAFVWQRAEDLPAERKQQLLDGLRKTPPPSRAFHQLISPQFVARASSGELSDLVIGEPQVAAKLLVLVNSAAYGLQSPVSSIGQAVTFLGLNSVRSICLQYMLSASFKAETPAQQQQFDAIWRASAVASELCLRLAQQLRLPDPGALVTQVVLSFLGHFAATACMRGGAATESVGSADPAELVDAQSLLARAQAQQNALGAPAAEIGGLLLQEWALPAGLIAQVVDIDRLLVTPPGAQEGDRASALAVCYLSARLGEKLSRGETVDLTRFDPHAQPDADYFHWAAYLDALPQLARLLDVLRGQDLIRAVQTMMSGLRKAG